jgi:hypothetical protein
MDSPEQTKEKEEDEDMIDAIAVIQEALIDLYTHIITHVPEGPRYCYTLIGNSNISIGM